MSDKARKKTAKGFSLSRIFNENPRLKYSCVAAFGAGLAGGATQVGLLPTALLALSAGVGVYVLQGRQPK